MVRCWVATFLSGDEQSQRFGRDRSAYSAMIFELSRFGTNCSRSSPPLCSSGVHCPQLAMITVRTPVLGAEPDCVFCGWNTGYAYTTLHVQSTRERGSVLDPWQRSLRESELSSLEFHSLRLRSIRLKPRIMFSLLHSTLASCSASTCSLTCRFWVVNLAPLLFRLLRLPGPGLSILLTVGTMA